MNVVDLFYFGRYSILASTQLLLGLIITIYLLRMRGRSATTRMLCGFFGMVTLSSLSYLVLVSGNFSRSYFTAYSMAILFSVGLMFLIQFAYLFARDAFPRERRALLAISAVIASALSASLLYLATQRLGDSRVYAGASFVFVAFATWSAVVLLRKTVVCSRERCPGLGLMAALWSPQGRGASAARKMALLTLLWLPVGASSMLEAVGFISIDTLIVAVTTGILFYLFLFALVYLNNTAEPSSFMVKTVGIPLVISLLIMNDMGYLFLQRLEADYERERLGEVEQSARAMRLGDRQALPGEAVARFSLSLSGSTASAAVFDIVNSDLVRTSFYTAFVAADLTRRVVSEWRADPLRPLNDIKRAVIGRVQRVELVELQERLQVGGFPIERLTFTVYYLVAGDTLFGFLYAPTHYLEYMEGYAMLAVLLALGTTVFILIFLPFVFRGSLGRPLASLLDGVHRVNAGDKDVEVEVTMEDEIGFLTRTFNNMVQSIAAGERQLRAYAGELQDSKDKLQEYSRTLEQRVSSRTADLQERNRQLEETLLELQETQNHLLLKEKMASLGQLVAGLSHEINSPVGAITSAADVSMRGLDRLRQAIADSPSLDDLQQSPSLQRAIAALGESNRVTQEAGLRVAGLIGSLRNFARLDEARFQRADLRQGIDDTLALLDSRVAGRITIHRRFSQIPAIDCAPGEINQVFLSILDNAINAIDRRGGSGEITISTTAASDGVAIVIEDTGMGMPPEQLDRIFDFGFSSTGGRVKMGSGLSIAYNIIQEHQGEILIASEQGRGTSVTIRLPQG